MPIHQRSFYMIRHGETEANKARIMAGHIDSPLTDLGRSQADEARKIIAQLAEKPDVIIHSNLSRARDTAAIINNALNVPMIEDSDYAEMHAGDWEGVSYEACDSMMHGWQDPPNGESYEVFLNRVKKAKNKALSSDYKMPLIVCHGGVFRAFAKLYDVNIWGVKNCHLHRFDPAPNTPIFPWDAACFDDEGTPVPKPSEAFVNALK